MWYKKNLIKFIFILFSVASPSLIIVSCGDQSNANNNDNSLNQTQHFNVDQFDYQHNEKNNFSNPLYINNKIGNINLPNGGPTLTVPGKNIEPRAKLLSKILPSPKYVELAKKSYALEMWANGGPKTGTCWILDYQLTSDNSYPTKWFFGTNAHVADDLMIYNNIAYPDNFANWNDQNQKFNTNNTEKISLLNLKDPITHFSYANYPYTEHWNKYDINLTVKNPNLDPNAPEIWEGYYDQNPKVKTILMGNDIFTWEPKDFLNEEYSNDSKYNNWKQFSEYMDFAVIEVNFASSDIAKKATWDYVNLDESKQFKYKEIDLLQEYIRKQQYIVSYPIVDNDSYSRELYVNKNISEYTPSVDSGGGNLGTSTFYSSFASKPSIDDIGVGFSYFGTNLVGYDNEAQINSFNRFNGCGLMYQLDYANLKPGASGSLVVDEDGYSLGVLFGSDQNASIGSMQAFYSNGYSYLGYYGKYNLPSYDLIRGGKPNQKKSYYDGLISIYGEDRMFKTNLFPNGLISRK